MRTLSGSGLAVALALAVAGGAVGCKSTGDELANRKLTGSFSAAHPELGTWTIEPIACESGRDYGFQGVLFRFPLPPAAPASAEAPAEQVVAPPPRTPAAPPEEIRFDAARDGDNTIELHYADRDATVRLIRERECASITGAVKQTNITYNDRPLVRLSGSIEFDCPAFGLHGRAEFDGCIPSLK